MAEYTVQNAQTGREITFDWNDANPPTDADMDEIFAAGEQQYAKEQPSPFRRIPDIGVTALKGAVGLPESIVGLADIATGGYAGKALEDAGVKFKETQDILDTWYSPQQQEANRKVSEAKGFLDTTAEMIKNPSTIATQIGESIPPMLGGAGVARGVVGVGGKLLSKAAQKALPYIAGGIGEGAVSAGQTAEQTRQETETGTLSAKQAGAATATGAITGLIGIAAGKLAQKFGVFNLETFLAGKGTDFVDDVAKYAAQSRLRKAAASAVQEGILEELPQSMQEQIFSNISLDKPWYEGVAEAGASGILTGAGMGFIAGGTMGNVRPPKPPPDPLAAEIENKLQTLNKDLGSPIPQEEDVIQNVKQGMESVNYPPPDFGQGTGTITSPTQSGGAFFGMPKMTSPTMPVDEQKGMEQGKGVGTVENVDVEAKTALDALADKIISGNNQFTPEELQLQNNYPTELEDALQKRIPPEAKPTEPQKTEAVLEKPVVPSVQTNLESSEKGTLAPKKTLEQTETVYRGTKDGFDVTESRFHNKTDGMYTTNAEYAREYGDKLNEVKITYKNPLDISGKGDLQNRITDDLWSRMTGNEQQAIIDANNSMNTPTGAWRANDLFINLAEKYGYDVVITDEAGRTIIPIKGRTKIEIAKQEKPVPPKKDEGAEKPADQAKIATKTQSQAVQGAKLAEDGEIIDTKGQSEGEKKEVWEMTREEYVYGDNQLSKLSPERWKEQFGKIPYKKTGVIKIYRGAFLKDRYGIKEGDWVTLDKKFAKENYAGEGGKVFEKEVPINELMLNAGTSQPGKTELIWKPEVSLETYNEKGEYTKLSDKHRVQVKQALSEGKPVPSEVLADYPDLAKPKVAEKPPIMGKDISKKKTPYFEAKKKIEKDIRNEIASKEARLRKKYDVNIEWDTAEENEQYGYIALNIVRNRKLSQEEETQLKKEINDIDLLSNASDWLDYYVTPELATDKEIEVNKKIEKLIDDYSKGGAEVIDVESLPLLRQTEIHDHYEYDTDMEEDESIDVTPSPLKLAKPKAVGKPKPASKNKLKDAIEKVKEKKATREGVIAEEFPNYKGDQDHASLVAEAVDIGKPVPPEVLKDYPDLVKANVLAEKPAESVVANEPYIERGTKVKGTNQYVLKIMSPEGKELGRTIGEHSTQGYAEALSAWKEQLKPTESVVAKDTISIQRVDQPEFIINRGDTVKVFFSHGKMNVGKVVGISHANKEVRVEFPDSVRPGGQWFELGRIYPAEQPKAESKKAKGKPISSMLNKEPPGGWTEADKVNKPLSRNVQKLVDEENKRRGKKKAEAKPEPDKTITSPEGEKKAEAGTLTIKEQKKYLISEIDKAIAEAPKGEAILKPRTFKNDKGELVQEKDDKGKLLYVVDYDKTPTVTIEVPGDGEFTIPNTKDSLKKFKDKVAKNFPATDDIVPTSDFPKLPSTKPTGKRITGGDVGISYYNPYKARKHGLVQNETQTPPRQFYVDGYFTNGAYAVKTAKPTDIPLITEGTLPSMKDILPEDSSGYQKAYIVGEFKDVGDEKPFINIIGQDGSSAVMNADMVDNVMTLHPKAQPKMPLDNQYGGVLFEVDGKNVAIIMPIRGENEFLASMRNRVQSLFEGALIEAGDDSTWGGATVRVSGIKAEAILNEKGKIVFLKSSDLPKFTPSPSDPAKVSAWVKDLQKLLSVEGIDFKVVPSSNQFPEAAVKRIKEGDVAVAVYVDGTIYINAQEIGSRTNLNQVAFHELIHAAGILKVLKQNEPEMYKKAIQALDEFKAKNETMWKTLLKDNDFDLDNPVHMEMAYEELLARIAEQKPKGGLMFRIMQMVRKILRKLGINERYSDKDIIGNLIKQSMAQARMVSEFNEMRNDPAFMLVSNSEFIRKGNKIIGVKKGTLEEIESEISSIITKSKADSTYMKAPNGKATNLPNERTWATVRTERFKNWFGDWENNPRNASKVVDANGEPLIIFSGHSNLEMYGDEYKTRLGTAGGFYSTENPKTASNYSMSKLGSKEYYEHGNQYRLAGKNGELNKKLWQYKLSEEQKRKMDKLSQLKDKYDEHVFNLYQMMDWARDNKNHEAVARRLLVDPYNLQNIWEFNEYMGYNIAYPEHDNDKPYYERQRKNETEELMDALGIKWNAFDWAQPGVMSGFLNIRKLLNADNPFPQDVLQALKDKAKYEREYRWEEDKNWTKEYPLKPFIQQIEEGSEFWSTQVPTKAKEIFQRFGYDGIKERGDKAAADTPREDRYTNWIVFEPEQIKSIFNAGTFSPETGQMSFLLAGKKAKGADLTAMNTAVEMDKQGKSKDAIWKETGWIKGKDGKWRFEIDDSKAEMKEPPVTNPLTMRYNLAKKIYGKDFKDLTKEEHKELSKLAKEMKGGGSVFLKDVLKHIELYSQYPELANTPIYLRLGHSESGAFGNGNIRITAMTLEQAKAPLLHEIQHAIQEREGFARGGSPEYVSKKTRQEIVSYEREIDDIKDRLSELKDAEIKDEYEIKRLEQILDNLNKYHKQAVDDLLGSPQQYRRLAGEAEAREVSNRMGMTAEQRANKIPSWDGIKEEDLIVRMEGGKNEAMSLKKGTGESTKTTPVAKPEGGKIPTPEDGNKKLIEEGWYVHGRKIIGKDTGLDTGYPILMTQNWDTANNYGREGEKGKGTRWLIKPSNNANILDATTKSGIKQVQDAAAEDFNDDNLPFADDIRAALDRQITEEDVRIEVGKAFNPDSIVDSAQGYDNSDWLNWFTDRFPDVDFVITEDGAVTWYDPDKIIAHNIDAVDQPAFSKSSQDQAYFDAVNKGDMKTAQKMVDEAAKKAGYTIENYHGTNKSFNIFAKSNDIGYHFGDKIAAKKAQRSTKKKGDWKIGKYYLDIDTPLEIPDIQNWRLFDVVPILKKEGILPQNKVWFDIRNEARDYVYDTQNHLVKAIEQGKPSDMTQANWNKAMQDYSNAVDDAQRYVLANYIKKAGYDSLIYYNIYEGGRSYIALDANQIKSADPVTYDDSGNVIPLSQRFQEASPDIRFLKSSKEIRENAMSFLESMGKDAAVDPSGIVIQGIASPEYYQHAGVKKIVKHAVDRNDTFHEMQHDFDSTPMSILQEFETMTDAMDAMANEGMSKKDIFLGKTSKKYDMFSDAINEADEYGIKEEEMEEKLRGRNTPEDVISLWKQARKVYDYVFDKRVEPMQELVNKIEEKARLAGKEPVYPDVMKIKDEEGNNVTLNLKQALQEMMKHKGSYAPRIREHTKWIIRGERKIGQYKRYIRKPSTSWMGSNWGAKTEIKKLKAEGWENLRIERNKQIPEQTYQALNTLEMSKFIEEAVNKGIDAENVKESMMFLENLIEGVADSIKARGFRSSEIQRKEGPAIIGYITDARERHNRYLTNTAAGMAKADFARKAMKEIFGEYVDGEKVGGISPTEEQEAYELAKKYIKNQLMNADRSDRVIAQIKSIAAFKYLTGPKNVFVNLTSLATTVIGSLHAYAGNGKVPFHKIAPILGKAIKDYGRLMAAGKNHAKRAEVIKRLFDKDEITFLEKFEDKEWDKPQYTMDAAGNIQDAYGKAWKKVMKVTLYGFATSERLNRGATLIAGFRIAKLAGLEGEQAWEAAHESMAKAHGLYSKATLPMIAQGGDITAKMAKLFVSYLKFPHTYLQTLYDMGFRKHDIKAFTFNLIAPVVLSGGTALAFKDVWFWMAGLLLKALGVDDDPEEWVYKIIRQNLGKGAEKAARLGVLGQMGVDVSGSLAIGASVPYKMSGWFGIGGGLYEDARQAIDFWDKGQRGRAAEKVLPTFAANPLKAVREAETGVITTKGNRVWTEEGKPFMPDTSESILQAFGFRSSRQGVLSQRTQAAKEVENEFNKKRKAIYEEYRAYLASPTPQKLKKVMAEIKEFNKKLLKRKLVPQLALIKSSSLKQQATKMMKPNKKEMSRYKER